MTDILVVRGNAWQDMVGFDMSRWWQCKLKVLVVTDSMSGGFGNQADFHLGLALDIVANDKWPHVAFDFTRAHRSSPGSGPVDIEGFRFDEHDLSQYSQIWLFGISRANDALSPGELAALARFMDLHKGGIFSTGDHENLGYAVSGEVPRVRSMRRWFFPGAGPENQPEAPSQFGSERHDTIASGTEDDSTPQRIKPRIYRRRSRRGLLRFSARFPHPVLCGPRGPIRFLPDHMHEGHCEVPSDLTKSFAFDGFKGDEYPIVDQNRVSPEVIATAESHGTAVDEFGVLSAYDGHRADVGRVLCDSTWHHWFNTNLRGHIDHFANPSAPGYSAADASAWLDIKAYFRNIGPWLAPPDTQRCLRTGGLLLVTRFNDFAITYRDFGTVRYPLEYFFGMGTVARDALGRLASQCQSTVITTEALEELVLLPDPWKGLGPDDPYGLDREVLEPVVLGAATHFVAERFMAEDPAKVLDGALEEVEAAARRGASFGARSYLAHIQRAGDEAARLRREVRLDSPDSP